MTDVSDRCHNVLVWCCDYTTLQSTMPCKYTAPPATTSPWHELHDAHTAGCPKRMFAPPVKQVIWRPNMQTSTPHSALLGRQVTLHSTLFDSAACHSRVLRPVALKHGVCGEHDIEGRVAAQLILQILSHLMHHHVAILVFIVRILGRLILWGSVYKVVCRGVRVRLCV